MDQGTGKSSMKKSRMVNPEHPTINALGQSYYTFCLETALTAVQQARHIVTGDIVDENHELPLIERKLKEALDAS